MVARWAARRGALVAGCVGLAASMGSVAVAQPAPAPRTDGPVEEIVVTGTRVRAPGLVSTSPITSLDAVAIGFSQPVAAEELIRTLPAATPAIGPGTNNGTGGGATVNLRGLGPSRTLVLLDGRRITPFDLNGAVDTNVVPMALVERVDVVTGGASVVYGADAITGVLNFILRDDFDGVEATASYGVSDRGDAKRRRADVTMGRTFADGRANLALSLGWTDTDPLRQDARPFGAVSVNPQTGQPSASLFTVPAVMTTPTARGGTPLGGPRQIDVATGRLVAPYAPYNFNPDNLFRTPLERRQATALAQYEASPHVELWGELRYVESDVFLQLAPTTTVTFAPFQVPIGNPFIPQPARLQLCAARAIPAAACVAGNPTEIPLNLGRRFTEIGPRRGDYENDVVQVTAGLRGEIAGSWRYDAYYSHGESEQTRRLDDWGSYSRVQQALRALNPTTCLDTRNGCVPLNVFGPAGSVTQAMVDFINLDAVIGQTVTQRVAAATVTGDLGAGLTSPWADEPVGVAFGYEWRQVEAGNSSDAASQVNGEVLGTGTPTPDRSGTLTLNEVSAELIAPIVTDRPFAHRVNLEAGVRHSWFTTEGTTDYTTWKAGADWAPVPDLRLRASYQRATRAPNVNELYAPRFSGSAQLFVPDPCAGAAVNPAQANTPGTLANLCRLTGVPVAQLGILPPPTLDVIKVTQGGNPGLDPEKAETVTLGLVAQPRFLEGLRLTLDWFDIELSGTIGDPTTDALFSLCYDRRFNPSLEFNAACGAIGRSPATGLIEGADTQGVLLRTSNLGRLATSGVDLGVNYRLPLEDAGLDASWGALELDLLATWVTRLETQTNPVLPPRDCLGHYSTPCGIAFGGANPRRKLQTRLTWEVADWRFGVLWRHTGPVTEEPGAPDFLPAFSRIPAHNLFDLNVAWEIADEASLRLSVLNLLDKAPPTIGTGAGFGSQNSGNTFPQDYDVIGRYYTLGLTLRF